MEKVKVEFRKEGRKKGRDKGKEEEDEPQQWRGRNKEQIDIQHQRAIKEEGGCMRGPAVNSGGETVNILHSRTHAFRHRE